MEKFKKGAIITILIAAMFASIFLVLSGLTINKYRSVELPEELPTITADSLHPEILYGWRDSCGHIQIEMRNYKPIK